LSDFLLKYGTPEPKKEPDWRQQFATAKLMAMQAAANPVDM
jgi:hypothetical protein